jgi:hypothetical protein
MINVTNDDITVVGSDELRVIQLVLLIQHYLNEDIETLNKAIDLLSDNVDYKFTDVLFHDCFFRFQGGDE